MDRVLLLTLITLCAVATRSHAEESQLSLDALLALDVDVASLTGTSVTKVPASWTVITREDIERTPARHILDLLEIYVPGVFWEGHSEMGHPGIRGIIADRNGKFLLLVNGKRMNQDAHNGAVSEIENYDLGDVERIEVIRGPGSVTYGPGAIMGVVNIVTRRAQNAPGWKFSNSANLQYRQSGVSMSYGGFLGEVELYSYFSATRTLGQKDTRFFVAYDSAVGYVGEDMRSAKEALHDTLAGGELKPQGIGDASHYMGDYWNTPQYKAHLDLNFGNGTRWISRYTNSGNVQLLTLGNGSKVWVPSEDRYANSSAIRIRQFSTSVENLHDFTPEFSTKASLDLNAQDFRRIVIRNPDNLFDLENYTHSFSETRGVASILARWTPMPLYKFAVGAEYARTRVGSPWFHESNMIRLGDAQNMFGDTSSENKAIYRGEGKVPVGYIAPDNVVYVGDGWDTYMSSLLGEVNMELHPLLNLLLSGRADKQEYAEWALSPRLSWIAQWMPNLVSKWTIQRSARVNFLEQGYMENMKGETGKPEVLEGVEAIMDWWVNPNLKWSTAIFYNRYELLGFSRAESTTVKVGDLETTGGELELAYSGSRFQVGANHALLRQIDFEVSEESKWGSGISYSDFHPVLIYKGDSLVMDGSGNHVNNWPEQSSKLFCNWQFHPRWNLHFDTRIFWGFPGGKDGLVVYTRNAEQLPEADSVVTRRVKEVVAELRERDFYETDFRLNMSLQFAFSKRGSFTLYCQNLLGWNGNKRYPYDAGDIRVFSSRWQAIEEPRTLGAAIQYSLSP